jgi:3-hydroxyacyl-CoA dehydrogenase / enoyl-CoA hydratase / 3-hydroxybutyryl-CoA epimerase / enoyl-CoA isomerase
MVGDPATREPLFTEALQVLHSQAESRPAASAAIDLMRRCATLDRDAALAEELRTFVEIIKTPAAAELVRAFLEEQQARRLARRAQATLAT